MTTIIKNQIVKQLARFTKNLSPSKINLKFLKGEGELTNLELNEAFLTDVLELPPFIRLTRAVCNKISAKIHWTRLKTDPIRLFLDCVEVEMEMTENVQEVDQSNMRQNSPTNQTTKEKPSEYGFVEKVVDGMLLTINSVIMAFRTPTFKATFQMSHLSVHSTDPNWEKASLRNTRIKDEAGREVLTFKQITFGTLRVDADALYKSGEEQESTSSAPLRLITSSAKMNIVIKKKIEDCSVISARLRVILEDVLWVLTHAQLRAVAGFAKSVVQVVERSKKCEPAPSVASDDSLPSQNPNSDDINDLYQGPSSDSPDKYPSSLFQREDVKETSYRVTTNKIDVHLCDDTPMDDNGQSGGSMQIVVNNLSFEHYPYHLAFTSRIHWPSHNEASLTRAQWVQELFNSYKKKVKNEEGKKNRRTTVNQKPEVFISQTNSRPVQDWKGNERIATDTNANSKKRRRVYLYECAFVISCDEFIVMPVATNEKMSSTSTPFLCSDKKSLYLPSDMTALQFDYTLYFYPGQEDAKVPQPNLFCQLNPLHLTMDDVTCIWFHRFMQSIRSGFLWAEELIAAQGAAPRHIDVRIEGLMPKLTLPCPSEPDSYYKQFRPQALQFQMSSFRASNTRIGSEFKQCDLVNTLEKFLQSKLYTRNEMFPNDPCDVQPTPQVAWLNDFSVCSGVETIEWFLNGVREDYSGNNASVVWMLNARQCWLDFTGIEEAGGRPRPFVEPFPLRMCMRYPIQNVTQPASCAQHVIHPPDDIQQQDESGKVGTTSERLLKPVALPLHRSPSEPYCKQPRSYSRNTSSSTRSTPLSSPGFAKVHKSRSATSVNIPVLESDLCNVETTLTSASHSSSISASRSGSDDSSDSFLADTCSGSAQSIPTRDIFIEGSVEKLHLPATQISKTTRLISSTSGAESMSDDFGKQTCERQDGVCSSSSNEGTTSNCGLSLLLYLPELVAIKLDHFQFVFLMRLQEHFLALRDVLFADQEKFEVQRRKLQEGNPVSSQEAVNEGPEIVVSLLSKGAEVSLLVPAPNGEQPDTGEEKESGQDLCGESGGKMPSPRAEVLPKVIRSQGDALRATKDSDDEANVYVSQNTMTNASDQINTWTIVGPEGHVETAEDLPEQRVAERSFSDASSTNTSVFDGERSSETRSSSVASERSFHGRNVSTVTIRGDSLECSLAMKDEDFAFKLLLSDCELKEASDQNLETFLSQKTKKKPKEPSNTSSKCGEISLRYALGSTIDQTLEGAVENGVAHLLLNDVMVSIVMSNLDGVLECVQDDVVVPPPFMPVIIDLKSLNVTIISDTPPRLLSLPPPLPLKLYVDQGTILRNAKGDFEIKAHSTPSSCQSEELSSTSGVLLGNAEDIVERYRAENNEMASRVLSIRNKNLRLLKELEISKEARESLETERDRLLMTVERLTDELVRSNREHDQMQEVLRQLKKT